MKKQKQPWKWAKTPVDYLERERQATAAGASLSIWAVFVQYMQTPQMYQEGEAKWLGGQARPGAVRFATKPGMKPTDYMSLALQIPMSIATDQKTDITQIHIVGYFATEAEATACLRSSHHWLTTPSKAAARG